MALEWFIVFITALVSTRMTNKLKRARKNQKEGEFIPLDESETDSEDWEKTVEGAKEIAAKSSSASKGKGPVYGKAKTTPTAAEKGKAPMQPTSMKRKTVARKRGRSRGIEIEEPLASEPDETPTPPRSKRPSTSSRQATTATAAPATAATAQAASGPTLFETPDDDASVTSIYREQQGLSSEQERLSIEQGRISLLDLQKISANLVVLKKEYNSMTKLVKKIFAKMGCSSSEESDSG